MDNAQPQECLTGDEDTEDSRSKSTSTGTVAHLADYEMNEDNGGLRRKDIHDERWIVTLGRGVVFRKKKFILPSDLLLDSNLFTMVRGHYKNTNGGLATMEEFAPIWERHKKTLHKAVNSRRSNVSNTMKGYFLGE